MSAVIRWIHISDLHFGLDNYFIKEMRDKLVPYIKCNLLHEDFSYLFVTGDLKYSKTCKKYPIECKEFISNLAMTAKIPKKNIFIVSGNHDLERTVSRKDVCNGIKYDYKKCSYEIDKSRYQVLKDSQLKFLKYINQIVEHNIIENTSKNPHYIIETKDVNILLINSALIASGDEEKGDLLIGREFLQKQLKNLNKSKPTIALAHHPFNWLDTNEARQLEGMLKDNDIYLYLCGHQHVTNAQIIKNINQTQDLYEITCGTLVDENYPYENSEMGFFVGELDVINNVGLVRAYRYQKKYNDWHLDTSFSMPQKNETGEFEINPKKKA